MLNLVSAFEHSARELPQKDAVIFGEHRFTYSQIDAMANQVANGLAKSDISKGDKIALSCPNLPFFPIVYFFLYPNIGAIGSIVIYFVFLIIVAFLLRIWGNNKFEEKS